MEQNTETNTPTDGLEELREQIALVQLLDLDQHSHAYEQIHIKLEEALRSIDGK